MKKRIWTALPVFLILVALMVPMSVATYYYNKILGIIEIAVMLAAFALVLTLVVRFRSYIKNVATNAMELAYSPDDKALEAMKAPTAVCGENGELLMYNSAFGKQFLDGNNGENLAIGTFLSGHTPEYAVRNGTIDVRCGDKRYTVFAHETKRGVLLEYIDDTYLKNTVDKYNQTKKSVAMLVFDNSEDFDDADQEVAAAKLTAENLLYRWANKHNILLRRLGESRYIAVFEEHVLVDQIKKKFRILDRIRAVTYNGRSTTISVGVGRDCENLTVSAAEAKKALDMALGRGGDQVAVLSGGEYQFFGGVAKGVEKTSKVKVRVRSEQIADAIKAADRVLITGHKFSDLDCIGAAAGMYALVSKRFKKACYVCTDINRTLAKAMIDRLTEEENGMFISPEKGLGYANEKTLLIIVDTHSPDFVESDRLYKSCGNVIIIDHHRRMVNYIDKASVFLHEPSASSASELVTEIIEYLADDVVSHVQAEALLAGIMLDTKNFVINTGVRSFEAAAYLRKMGADTVTVRNVFANSLENYRDKSRLVSSAQIYRHCAITVAEQPIQNSRVVCAQAADDLLSIEDTYASFVISAIDVHSVNISARSFGKINVQVLMEKLGGGGHQTMAAAQLVGVSLKEAKEQLIKVLEESLD